LQQQAHFGTHVGEAVDGRHGHVPALYTRPMAEIRAIHVEAARPDALFGMNLDEAARRVVIPAYTVEHEKLGLGAEISGIAQPARLEVGLGALGDGTWVAVVALH